MDCLFEEDAIKVNFEQVVRVALSRESTISNQEMRGLMETHVKEELAFLQIGHASNSNIYKTSGSRGTTHRSEKNVRSGKRFCTYTNKCFICGRISHKTEECI